MPVPIPRVQALWWGATAFFFFFFFSLSLSLSLSLFFFFHHCEQMPDLELRPETSGDPDLNRYCISEPAPEPQMEAEVEGDANIPRFYRI